MRRIYELNERRQRSENELWGHVIHTLDAETASSRSPAVTEGLIDRCEQAWRDFKDVTVQLGMKKLFLNEAVRNPISLAIRWGTMLIIGWSVSQGRHRGGQFSHVCRADRQCRRAVPHLYAFQKQIMDTRPALRQLGTLCGIDFGITPPKYAAPVRAKVCCNGGFTDSLLRLRSEIGAAEAQSFQSRLHLRAAHEKPPQAVRCDNSRP